MALLQDKIVLVTGAGAGIGRATALAMAAEGAVLAAADIDRGAAERTSADCNEGRTVGNSRRAIAIEADCGDVASIDRMIAQAVAGLGRLDVIVNNAGVTRFADIMDLTEADWDRIHRDNAKGVFFCLQRAAGEMIRQFEANGSGGRIVNIASISGRGYAGASNAAYAASKGAVISLTKMAAQQLGRFNISQCHLPGHHADRARRPQRGRARGRARHHGRAAFRRTGSRHPDPPRQHARRHRRDGGVPGFAGRPQRHRPVL